MPSAPARRSRHQPLARSGLLSFKHRSTSCAARRAGGPVPASEINGTSRSFKHRKANPRAGAVDEPRPRAHRELSCLEGELRASRGPRLRGLRDPEDQIARPPASSSTTKRMWSAGRWADQHANAVDNVARIVNVLLSREASANPALVVCPVRGHSNVQGDRTMASGKSPAPRSSTPGSGTGIAAPRKHGLDTVEAIHALHAGSAKVFFAWVETSSRLRQTLNIPRCPLRRARLTAHVSTSSTARTWSRGAPRSSCPAWGGRKRTAAAS